MAKAILCCGDESRGYEIRQALTDAGAEVTRQYGSTQTLLTAMAQYGDAEVDLLVVDETSTPMPMWELSAEISGRYPSVAVLTVVTEPTSQDYATALDSGSRGVISYPLNFENLAARIQSAAAWSTSLRLAVNREQSEEQQFGGGKMIAVASSKGGAGASTLALHLALEAAQSSGRKVVLLDLDLQKPDQSILLDIPKQRDITDLLPVIDELSPRFVRDVLFEHPSGLSVLLGPKEGEQGELITEQAAKKILGILRSRFDIVIVDVGSYMGEANATAVEMADEVAVVTQSDVLSLRGVRRLVGLWERIGARRSEDLKIVLNSVHKTNDIQPESARKIVALPTYKTVVPRMTRALEQSVNRREPAAAGNDWSQKVQELGREMQVVPPVTLAKAKETKTRRTRKKEDGQSSIEFVGVFLCFIVLAVLVLQLVLVGVTWMFASHTASEAARAAAVGHSIVETAEDVTPRAWQNGMQINENNGRVNVSMRPPMLVPMTDVLRLSIDASAGVVRE
ncbi:AAA family ATPase [Nesterenkonia rhizosphaerae]|uniref:Response regulatory domain-containing protein n=2 Tax=Nesterenkonia TaxID=57494 RepID=A0ABP9FUH5_9MICC